MLAISSMDPAIQGIFFLVAVVCFALAAIGFALGRIELVAAGLAFFAFVFMWNAFAAA
jgi:hypothetical protein